MCQRDLPDWPEWLDRFERLFKSMPAREAYVVLDIVCWGSGEFDGRFYYKWELTWPEEVPAAKRDRDSRVWMFHGGPRSFT